MHIYIDTLGCPKNITDSEAAAGILEASGHTITDDPARADAILVNTCGFINDAKEESIDRILEMATFKQKDALLLVSGCLSQRYGEELSKLLPEVDLFLGVDEYQNLPALLGRAKQDHPAIHIEREDSYYRELGPRKSLGSSHFAYLKIAEGCDNVCAYCIIPAIRGAYRSRTKESILAEAIQLVSAGSKELILVAQDVTAYGIDLYGTYELPTLLDELSRINGLHWIRLMYCYEDRITDELIAAIVRNKKVCRYLDIPIQHASDAVLSSMYRRSTRESIHHTIARLREAIPDIRIRTTLITGFPGETNEDFKTLLQFVEETRFDRLGVFAYSKEEGTEAARRKDQVRKQTKESRRERIMKLQQRISLDKNREYVGKNIEVLIEEIGEDYYVGRSAYDAPEIDNSVILTSRQPLSVGDFVWVRIEDAFDYDLSGEYISKSR